MVSSRENAHLCELFQKTLRVVSPERREGSKPREEWQNEVFKETQRRGLERVVGMIEWYGDSDVRVGRKSCIKLARSKIIFLEKQHKRMHYKQPRPRSRGWRLGALGEDVPGDGYAGKKALSGPPNTMAHTHRRPLGWEGQRRGRAARVGGRP